MTPGDLTPSGAQVKGQNGMGESQPPRNRIVPIAHMVRIAMYSPRKKSRNGLTKSGVLPKNEPNERRR